MCVLRECVVEFVRRAEDDVGGTFRLATRKMMAGNHQHTLGMDALVPNPVSGEH